MWRMGLEILGLEKCELTREEIARAFAAVSRLALELGWEVPSYALLVFASSETECAEFKEREFVELEEGLLVKDGTALVVLGGLLPNVLLDKLFVGFLALSYYETFREISPGAVRELVREKYMSLLSTVYGAE